MSGIVPEGGTPAAETPAPTNPWARWEEAGFKPDANPFELRQQFDYLSELANEETHEPALERGLRSWGHLQEGESLDDFRLAMELIRAERDDPFGGGGDGEPDEAQPAVDPRQMREVMQADFDRMLEAKLSERDSQAAQEREAERLAASLNTQRDELAKSLVEDLGDKAPEAAKLAFDRAIYKLQTGAVADAAEIPALVKASWDELATIRQAQLGAAVAAAQGAPTTTTPGGAAPAAIATAQQQGAGRGLDGAMARTATRLGIDPSQLD